MPPETAYIVISVDIFSFGQEGYCLIDGLMVFKGDRHTLDYYVDTPRTALDGLPTKQQLLDTGIDIENKKVTVTADRFEVRNNSGEVTARVNENGLLQVGSGEFSGLIRQVPFVIENVENDKRLTLDNEGYGWLKKETLVTGGFIVVTQNHLGYIGQGFNLPVGYEYAGTRIFIIKRYTTQSNFTIRTSRENIPAGYNGGWCDMNDATYGNLFRIRNRTARVIWMGHSGSADNEFLELVAMPKTIDKEEDGEKKYGHVEWVVMNAWQWDVKTASDNSTLVGYRLNGY